MLLLHVPQLLGHLFCVKNSREEKVLQAES